MTKKYFYIYKTTNTANGKYYIGMHTAVTLSNDYLGSGKILKRAIRKHGREAFVKEILEYLPTSEALVSREVEIITEELISDPNCMNIRLGGWGGGGWSSEQQKVNAQRSNVRQKVLRDDPDWVQQKSFRLSKSLRLAHKEGRRTWKIPPHNGWKHSEESKLKQKLALSLISHQKGPNNSCFGSMWITNGIENAKLKNDSRIPDGWWKGRKIKRIAEKV